MKIFSYWLILFLSFFSFSISDYQSESIMSMINKDNYDELILEFLLSGFMGGYPNLTEYYLILDKIAVEFSEILKVETIGTTSFNNRILSVNFGFKTNSTVDDKIGILFTGMHHAREPVSMLMNLYIIFILLRYSVTDYEKFIDLTSSRSIYFIPLINPDGYSMNLVLYRENYSTEFAYVRKNMRNSDIFNDCCMFCKGVDLNRNYEYKFNNDEIGSSSIPCQDTYRGEFPFSEPETLSIKNFVEAHKNIKLAYNYHSFGNMFIIPFNYDPDPENLQLLSNRTYFKIYSKFINEANFPENNKFGNVQSVFGYTSNGECADWMLNNKGIIAFSPELGINNTESDQFYPTKNIAQEILKQNLESATYGIIKAGYYLAFDNEKTRFFKRMCDDILADSDINNDYYYNKIYQRNHLTKKCKTEYLEYYSIVSIENSGFKDFDVAKKSLIILIKINSTNVEFIEINLYKENHRKFSTIYSSDDKRNFTLYHDIIDNIKAQKSIIFDFRFYVDINTDKDLYLNAEIEIVVNSQSINNKTKSKTFDIKPSQYQLTFNEKFYIPFDISFFDQKDNEEDSNEDSDDENSDFMDMNLNKIVFLSLILVLLILVLVYLAKKLYNKSSKKVKHVTHIEIVNSDYL